MGKDITYISSTMKVSQRWHHIAVIRKWWDAVRARKPGRDIRGGGCRVADEGPINPHSPPHDQRIIGADARFLKGGGGVQLRSARRKGGPAFGTMLNNVNGLHRGPKKGGGPGVMLPPPDPPLQEIH